MSYTTVIILLSECRARNRTKYDKDKKSPKSKNKNNKRMTIMIITIILADAGVGTQRPSLASHTNRNLVKCGALETIRYTWTLYSYCTCTFTSSVP